MSKIIYYESIPRELERLQITQKEAAKMLGLSLSGFTSRIASDKSITHWMIYGLANYLEPTKPRKRIKNAKKTWSQRKKKINKNN